MNERAEQFQLEAQWVAQLARHPHIVRVLDYNIENGQPFIMLDKDPLHRYSSITAFAEALEEVATSFLRV